LQDMDSLPRLDYDDYFQQMGTLIPDLKDVPVWLYYETSRGCWWGAKHHCTFCGLNANGMAFRERSPDKVVDELRTLTQRYPSTKIAMTDNIMPFRYHKTLIPKLANELPELHIFYEQKANLTLDQVNGLYKAGNVVIQPGIESLSTELLTLMRKGVRAWQNIALLRYARAVGMGIKWNLLYSFPNDTIEPYQEMLELIPKINHLTPPNALTHLSIDRFSPYFEQPDEFGLERIEPLTGYRDIFPEECDVEKLAYHFTARYRSASRESAKLMWQLYEAVTTWQDAWKNGENESPPMLHVQRRQDSSYLLYDTRAGSRVYNLNAAQAEAALIGGPIDSVPMAKWAIHNRFAVHLDDRCVPLATANYETLSRLERKRPVHQESLTQLQRLH